MKIHNGLENVTVTAENFGTASIDSTRIILTYTGAFWGELALEVQNAAYSLFDNPDDCKDLIYYQQVIESADIAVRLDIQRQTIRAAAVVDITATNGRTKQAKIKLDLSDADLTAMLDAFFSGNTGLNPDYERHYKRFYELWKRSRHDHAA